jgi:putative transposase
VQRWLAENKIKTLCIEPCRPWPNGESFRGWFRDKCLNRGQLWTLTKARVVIENYWREYNQRRPHSRLAYESPAAFAAWELSIPAPPPLQGMDKTRTINLNEPILRLTLCVVRKVESGYLLCLANISKSGLSPFRQLKRN